jgi:hypothetical protein
MNRYRCCILLSVCVCAVGCASRAPVGQRVDGVDNFGVV